MVHDKSSLAPEGKTVAFNLGNEEGFYWLDGYGDITAEELLSGFSHDTVRLYCHVVTSYTCI